MREPALFAVLLVSLTISSSAKPTVKVKTDARVELIAVIQILTTGYPVVTPYDSSYKQQVRRYFGPFQNHRAVTLFLEIAQRGFNFSYPPTSMLYFSDVPTLKPQIDLPADFGKRAGGKEKLDEFIQALRDFAKDSNFESFYRNHRGLYDRLLSNARSKTKGLKVSMLEDYYGVKQNSYQIILSPLLHDGGFGPRVRREDGTYDIYSIDGPHQVENDLPIFGTPETFRYLVWHEFSHSFVNPLVEVAGDELKRFSPLLEPITDQMKREGNRDWESVVKEHIVRAATVRFTYRELGKAAGDAALKNEVDRGYIYVPALCKRLESYETRRKRYPTLKSFLAEILKVFETALLEKK